VPAGSRRQDRSAFDDESKRAHDHQVDKQCGWKAGAMRVGALTRLGRPSFPFALHLDYLGGDAPVKDALRHA